MLESDLALLANRLRSLDPLGESGFEGLLRDILETFAGRPFRLSKPGPQGGVDVRSGTHDTVQIGLEAKRYGAGTTLPLDQLKAKLLDAARQADPPDLWILAATRPISDTDQRELKRIGTEEGVSVLVLDWPGEAQALPHLAVLCAAVSEAIGRRFNGDGELEAALGEIRKDSRFTTMRDAIAADLTRADVGFAAAASMSRRWLEEAQSSNTTARIRLDGFNDLRSPEARVVNRPSLVSELSAWWSGKNRLAALVGEEGYGKTWAALGWVTGSSGPPMVLFMAARSLTCRSIEETLAETLARITRVRDQTFWARRVRLWRRATYRAPLILLVIDGLDQHWLRKDWIDLFQPLYDEGEWNGLCSVLVTCRPEQWGELEGLSGLAPPPLTVEVPKFSEAELDRLLELHGLDRSGFDRSVLELMRVPRLSVLAITRRAELAASGDVTPERLAYEDWKHRLSRKKHPLGFTDGEFRNLVTELGEGLRDADDEYTISRRDLVARMTKDSGRAQDELGAVLSELIDGGWLEVGDRPHLFRVRKDRVPFALGLTLAAELREVMEAEVADEKLAEFLDPLKGQSLGVAVLRVCTRVH